MTICLAYFDGLDSLIEYYLPAARDYPIALGIYVLILITPLIGVLWIARHVRPKRNE